VTYVYREELDTEISVENLEADGREAATFCDVDGNSVDTSPAVLVSHCEVTGGKTTEDSNEMRSTVSYHHLTNSNTLSSGETASTSLTTKLEPGVEERNKSTSRQENHKRCHDNMNDVIKGSMCAKRIHDGRRVHFTVTHPSVSFSHRRDCPCGPPPPTVASSSGDISVTEGQSRHRRRRTGLSRLRRTELRRRSRTVMDVTEDLAGGLDETASVAVNGLGIDRTAPSDVMCAESHTVFGGQNCFTSVDAPSELDSTGCEAAVVKPNYTDVITKSSNSEKPSTSSVASSVVGLTTATTAARKSTESRRTAEKKLNEKVTVDITFDCHLTNRCTPVDKKRLLLSTQPADRVSTTVAGVSTRSFDVSRTSAASIRASPLSVRRTLDCDIVSRCGVVNAPLRAPFSPVLHRTQTQSVVADTAASNSSHGSRSLTVVAPRCYTDSAVKWRRCYGKTEKQRDIVMWMQMRGVALAAPVLRYALTALKHNTLALVNSPACYIPRHIPIFYPRYRLLCYQPSPCV